MWVLAGNGIILSVAAGFIRLHMSGVERKTKARACRHTHYANHWQR